MEDNSFRDTNVGFPSLCYFVCFYRPAGPCGLRLPSSAAYFSKNYYKMLRLPVNCIAKPPFHSHQRPVRLTVRRAARLTFPNKLQYAAPASELHAAYLSQPSAAYFRGPCLRSIPAGRPQRPGPPGRSSPRPRKARATPHPRG